MCLILSCCYTAATLQLAGAAGSKRRRRWSRGNRLGWRLSADPLDLNSKRYEVKGFHLMSVAFRGLFWSLLVSYFRPHRHCLTRPPWLGTVEQPAPVPVCVFMVFWASSLAFGPFPRWGFGQRHHILTRTSHCIIENLKQSKTIGSAQNCLLS